MKKLLFLLIVLAALGVSGAAQRFYTDWDWRHLAKAPDTFAVDTAWGPDVLEGYESRFVPHARAFDGPVRSTIIRKRVPGGSRRAFLYVHGFNDYFFQSLMGELMVDSGINFYAVDLRRYGRSRLPWQYPFNVRDQKEYFEDIDSALAQIRRDGNTDITLGGHSTGGLTVLLYAAERGSEVGVQRVVTNSPFLEWNFNAFLRKVAIPVVSFGSHVFQNARIKQARCDGYAFSLLRRYHGQWDYNTQWKMVYSPPVKWSWIRSINGAQRAVRKKGARIAVPTLVMHSSRKIDGCNWTPDFQTGDCVLNPFDIRKIAEAIAERQPLVHTCVIDSGLHDLILSEPRPRQAAYDSIFSFINRL